jgi:hypothetical protein
VAKPEEKIPCNLGEGGWIEIAVCAFNVPQPRRDYLERIGAIEAGQPDSWSWHVLPWEDDPWAQAAFRVAPEGQGYVQIMETMGATRQRQEQVLTSALRKLKNNPETRRSLRAISDSAHELRAEAERVPNVRKANRWVSVTPYEEAPSGPAEPEKFRHANRVPEAIRDEIAKQWLAARNTLGRDLGSVGVTRLRS